MPVACGSQKRALDPPALELRMVVSHHVSSGFQIQVPLQERKVKSTLSPVQIHPLLLCKILTRFQRAVELTGKWLIVETTTTIFLSF